MLLQVRILSIVLVLLASMNVSLSAGADAKGSMLSHIVFFKLKEASDKDVAALVESCNAYLSGHAGTVSYYAGARARELDRDVNDAAFDVTLHILFRNMKAHDQYQKHPRHMAFIEKNKDNWANVRVFDSLVKPMPRKPRPKQDPKPAKRLPIPDQAAGFCGNIKAKVVANQRKNVVVEVLEILKTWEHNKAKEPAAMKGKMLIVVPRIAKDDHSDLVVRYMKGLKKGQVISLDVANKEGETLMLLELNEEQRQQMAGKKKAARKKKADK